METFDPETQDNLFVWDATLAEMVEAEAEAEPAVELKTVTLRSTALEALDLVAEDAATAETSAPAIAPLQIQIESETEDAAPVAEVTIAAPSAAEPVEAAKTDDVEVVQEIANPDQHYIAECIALLYEIFPGGLEAIFEKGVAEGMFTLAWGNGPVSGQDSWTNADLMVLDAVYKLTEDAGIDLRAVWNDFTEIMAERLYPDGVDIDNLATALQQKGPISGQTEWTNIDYRAFDVMQSMLWSEHIKTQMETSPLDHFNDAYPNGISELFPDGYSDDALETLLEGNGLYSGEAEWTEADEIIFEGLWQALVDSGFEPFADDEVEFEPMPIVIDDGEWFEDEADYPVMVGCDLMPPPEVVVCTFVNEDLTLI